MTAFSKAPRLLAAAGVLFSGLCVFAEEPRRYDGRTLEEVRELIPRLDYESAARGAVVPALRAVINDDTVPWFTRRQAALTLGRIGAPAGAAVADLIKLLEERADPVETGPRLWSLKALALFGPLAVDAAPEAIRILTDRDESIILRLTATETLGRIGVQSSDGLEALIDGAAGRLETLNATDQLDLRIACIEALQLAGPPSAVPTLIAACADDSERVRHAAAATLGFLGTRAELAAETLGTMVVHDDSPIVREAAARSLARMGEPGLVILQRLLANDDHAVLAYALDAAGRTTGGRRRMAPLLKQLFTSRDHTVAVSAMDAWWQVTRDAEPILDRLVRFLEEDDRQVRKVASDVLMRMGPAALPARGRLERLAANGTDDAQAAAKRVLRALVQPAD